MTKYDFRSYVYVMKLFTFDGGYYYKVGISNKPERRSKELRRQYKVERVQIIWTSPNLAESTARRIENSLLKMVSEKYKMIRKECFEAEEPLSIDIKIRKVYEVREELEEVEVDIN